MTINHHLNPATIIGCASGTLAPAIATVAMAHVAMCEGCRKRVKAAEAIGGALLEELSGAPLQPTALSNTLARLDSDKTTKTTKVERDGQRSLSVVQSLIEGSFNDVKWKKAGSGIGLHSLLDSEDDGKLFLLKIDQGKVMPDHGHGGSEITLILSGAYEDKFGRFARGDVADLDSEVDHQPIASDDAVCICLVATEKPTVFKSLLPRLLQPLIGI